MRNKTRTILFLVAGLILLAGMVTSIAVAREGVWGAEWLNWPSMYRLGPEVQISTPSTPLDAHRHQPAVVHNWKRKQYLVAWHNEWPGNRDIYAQRLSESGQRVGGWFAVSAGPDDRIQPSVAYNATDDECLIVWMKEVSSDVYEIWGRIIAWNNSYQNPEFKIISWANRNFYTPRVAWNSIRNEYLVVWNAFNTSGGFPGVPNDIAGARISNTGSILSISILTTYSGPHQVDITYNVATNEYFLAFVVVHTAATSGNDIYGLRVGWNGSPVGGLIVIYEDDIAGQRKHQNHPAVATNEGDKYMVVWEHTYTTTPQMDRDIYAREYNADGTPDGSYFTISSWTQDDTVPDVAANGANREWVVVWQRALPSGAGYSIHGFRWGSAGSPAYIYLFDVINWTFYECRNPVVAADIPGYLIVYEELVPSPPFYQHIYGRMWWPGPQAAFTVNPSSGDTDTVFQFDASSSSDADPTSALEVRWDWENDGTYDTSWNATKTASHSYPTPGFYNIRLEVRNTDAFTDTGTRGVTVQAAANTPPNASFSVNPTSGDTSTAFSFDASSSTDAEDPTSALQVRWDWQNSGTYDTAWSTTKTASHSYVTPGTYTIRLQVRDIGGLTHSTTRQVTVQAPSANTPPNASFTVNPTSGDTSTLFSFDASGSTDAEDGVPPDVRWDWNNDGTFDTGWNTVKTATHTFNTAGTHTVRLEVRDTGSLTDATTRQVTVGAPHFVYLPLVLR